MVIVTLVLLGVTDIGRYDPAAKDVVTAPAEAVVGVEESEHLVAVEKVVPTGHFL